MTENTALNENFKMTKEEFDDWSKETEGYDGYIDLNHVYDPKCLNGVLDGIRSHQEELEKCLKQIAELEQNIKENTKELNSYKDDLDDKLFNYNVKYITNTMYNIRYLELQLEKEQVKLKLLRLKFGKMEMGNDESKGRMCLFYQNRDKLKFHPKA